MLKVFHHRHKCIGCNYCVELAPAYYQIDANDGKVNLFGSNTNGNMFELLVPETELAIFSEVKAICPTQVIKFEKRK